MFMSLEWVTSWNVIRWYFPHILFVFIYNHKTTSSCCNEVCCQYPWIHFKWTVAAWSVNSWKWQYGNRHPLLSRKWTLFLTACAWLKETTINILYMSEGTKWFHQELYLQCFINKGTTYVYIIYHTNYMFKYRRIKVFKNEMYYNFNIC